MAQPTVDVTKLRYYRVFSTTVTAKTAAPTGDSNTATIVLPDCRWKWLCAGVTVHGNTAVLCNYPQSETTWVATHDPAHKNAEMTLNAVALYDPDNLYETVIREQSGETSIESYNPLAVVKSSVLQTFTLVGGGFKSKHPVTASYPEWGKVWVVSAARHTGLSAFSVGLRRRKTSIIVREETPSAHTSSSGVERPLRTGLAAVVADSKVDVRMDGGRWYMSLPEPHGEMCFSFGSVARQDPVVVALHQLPSAASRVALSKAPPAVWQQYRRPLSTEERGDIVKIYCTSTKSKKTL